MGTTRDVVDALAVPGLPDIDAPITDQERRGGDRDELGGPTRDRLQARQDLQLTATRGRLVLL